ncbi:GNAT family N-acetyltransferase [Paenibacillus sp.]|uniref:GNAT family N-acetyltransferase n=1 Tax=unclassified Paenibacillus TaxID=185978 RepID=UPI0037C93C48
MLTSRYIQEGDQSLLEQFQCDDEVTVRKFLTEEALNLHLLNLASTRLYFNEEGNLVGYFTLYNDMMQIGKSKRIKHKVYVPSYKFYPAVKLHYLGVDSRYRKNGFGEYLLLSVLEIVTEIARLSGCIFLSVESLPNAVGFYNKYEFQYLSNNKPFINMFFKVNELTIT